MAFYRNDQYQQQTLTTVTGHRLFPLVRASGCNADPLRADTLTVQLRAVRSGQSGAYTAIETAPNTGVFVLQQPLTNRDWRASARAIAGAFDVMPGDVIEATASDCKRRHAERQAPAGQPRVHLRHQHRPAAGRCAGLVDRCQRRRQRRPCGRCRCRVRPGRRHPHANVVMSDADGGYSFPFLLPSQYRLMVAPPTDYAYPSSRTADLAAGWSGSFPVDAASYGAVFRVTAATDNAVVNLPLDPIPGALLVQKMASRNTVEIAETLEYAVSVKNTGQAALSQVRLLDTLPLGFRYVPGSTRIDGRAAADPTGGAGPRLTWTFAGALQGAAEHTVRYRVRVGTGCAAGRRRQPRSGCRRRRGRRAQQHRHGQGQGRGRCVR